jgi:hypothetical protein
MGKQVNFYMTAEDEQEFLSYIRSDRDVGIFKYTLPSTDIPFLNELPPHGEPFWAALWLWDRDHSPPPVLTYVERQKYYTVAEVESEVIEFDRCGLDEGRLVRGRIWAEMNGLSGDTKRNPRTTLKVPPSSCTFDWEGLWTSSGPMWSICMTRRWTKWM